MSPLLAAVLLSPAAPPADTAADIFERRVRPMLVEHCAACHSAAKARGGLALDSREALLRGGDTGPAVVPGQPGESLLVQAIRYEEADLRMPPRGKLSAEQVADLEKWVAAGAAFPDSPAPKPIASAEGPRGAGHWSFRPVRRDDAPGYQVDRFLLSVLEAKGISRAADAPRPVWLRRATLVLTGLPPTPAELDAFSADPRPDADARAAVADRLLASPSFGERWGRHWLDAARFAESSGGGRSLLYPDAWRYRDYVIRAFNDDTPYDRFLREQVAGDLLPAATPAERERQITATAFLMLGPTNYEAQDKTILEMDVIDEQLDTLGKSVLGMTIGCARCHDHKFDPIPTRDYYALAGILKSTRVLVHDNVSAWTNRPLPVPDTLRREIDAHAAKVRDAESRLGAARAELPPLAPAMGKPIAPSTLPGLVVDDAASTFVGPWKASTFSNFFVGAGYRYDDRGAPGEKTATFVPKIPSAGRYEVRLAYVPNPNRATNVPVRVFHADGESTLTVNMRRTPAVGERFHSLGTFRFEPGEQYFVMLSTAGTDGHVVADAAQFVPEGTSVPAGDAKGAVAAVATLEAELKRLKAAAPAVPTAMAPSGGTPGDCAICIRGNVHRPGPVAPRGFLSAAPVADPPGVPTDASGRLELADWLTRPDHPLTARVHANRVWHHVFGTGIVRTVDQFGTTGELPSHPELLDHLAAYLVRDGWSTKRLVRALVLSRTFALSGDAPPNALAADPENRLLSHFPRRRLEAEAIRDAMLAVSGELTPSSGGPFLQAGVGEREAAFTDTRRSVYTPVLRNKLPDLFEAFDFADPNFAAGRRNVSTVPTQALFLMNHPFALERATAAARRILKESPERRVPLAFRLCLGRTPTPAEAALVSAHLSEAGPGGEARAWARVFQSLFGCVDFRYIR